MKPVEKVPVKYSGLFNFWDRDDPSGLTVEIFGGAITEEELAKFKDLHNRQKKVGELKDADEQGASSLNLSESELLEFYRLNTKIGLASEELIHKID